MSVANTVSVAASCPCGSRLNVTEVDGGFGDLNAAVTAWMDRHGEPHKGAPGTCHCGRPAHIYDDSGMEGFTRGLCLPCSTVRCDVQPAACGAASEGHA